MGSYQQLINQLPNIKQSVMRFLEYYGPGLLRDFKIFCFIFSGITIISIIITLIKSHEYLRESFLSGIKGTDVPIDKPGKLKRQWAEIENQISAENTDQAKIALIKADALLDNIMKKAGFPGETMGDRLKQFDKTELSNIEDVWQAHKLRNKIAHEPNKEFRFIDIKKGIKAIQKALEELQGI